jgi:O-antigen/teichoic acid export membrane protein
MKKLFFSSFAVNILVMALNMGTGIIMARYLGPYGRGELAMATRWAVLFAGLSTLGLPGAMIYLGKNFKEKQREIFGAFLMTGALVGLAALVICQLLTLLIMSGETREMILLGQLALLALPFAVMTDGLIGTLQSFNSFRKVLLTRILNPLGTLAALAGLILTGNVTVFNIILLNVIWGAGTFFLIIYWIFKVMKPKFTRLFANAKMLLQYGVKIYASSLVQVFGGSFDQILLSLTLSAYALGIYTVASSIGSILPSILYGALNVFLAPRLMDFSGEQRRREVSRIHAIFFYGTAVAAACGCLVLPFVIPFMYGQEFSEAVLLGIILLLTSPVKIGYSILLNFFAAEGKFNVLSKTEIIGLVTGFGALLILVRFTGAAGAAWALGTANLAKWGYLIVQAKKLKVPVAGLFRLQPGEVLALLRGFQLKKPLPKVPQ